MSRPLDVHGDRNTAAQALALAVHTVEKLCADLVDAGMIERAWVQCGQPRDVGDGVRALGPVTSDLEGILPPDPPEIEGSKD